MRAMETIRSVLALCLGNFFLLENLLNLCQEELHLGDDGDYVDPCH